MIERNRARKTWQFTRDPSDKRVLNNIQNRIHRKVKAFQNKIWEDELRALDPDDGSLWEMSKELRKKKSPVYALNGQGGIAHTDSDKAEKSARPRKLHQRLARPISCFLHASRIQPKVVPHIFFGFGMEARFASHMPRKCHRRPLHRLKRTVINPSKIWPAFSSSANWLSIEDFFIGAVFVHSDNVICPFNSLYFDEVNNVRFFI
ncbi:hypothetical protein TNCV_1382711 [Trichonephila clavipes]|nr:hypothetical protein TNCV_1382711 [Trichonephila clavipes]